MTAFSAVSRPWQDAAHPRGGCRPAPVQKRVHFIGIGGSGLAPLALVALKAGWAVSGSDAADSERLRGVAAAGASTSVGHSALHVLSSGVPDAVVASSAVKGDNAELAACRALGLKAYKRTAWLAAATRGRELIAIAGSHGKTSTTAMMAVVLRAAGRDPTAVVGGDVPQFPGGAGALLGSGPQFVLEADEYDGAFLGLRPTAAVVTNVEWEHVDLFPNEAAVAATFRAFASRVRPGGVLLLCGDHPGARALADVFDGPPTVMSPPPSSPGVGRDGLAWRTADDDDDDDGTGVDGAAHASRTRHLGPRGLLTYGTSVGCDWRAVDATPNDRGGCDYRVEWRGSRVATVSLAVPGAHSVLNSLAALATASTLAAAAAGEGASTPVGAAIDVAALASAGTHIAARAASHPGALADAAVAAAAALADFSGVRRRFEFVGAATLGAASGGGGVITRASAGADAIGRACAPSPRCVCVYDDYAHHPSEIAATLAAARLRHPRATIWAAVQPHTYSRLRSLLTEFGASFGGCDRVLVSDVYAARERDTLGVGGADLVTAIAASGGPPAIHVPRLGDLAHRLAHDLEAGPGPAGGTVVLTLGAGDITDLGTHLLDLLERK